MPESHVYQHTHVVYAVAACCLITSNCYYRNLVLDQ